MTHPRFLRRRERHDDDAALCPACRKYICACGDLQAAAAPAPWDGTTIPLDAPRGQPRYTPHDTAPLSQVRARGQRQDSFPALPELPPPPPPRREPDYAIFDVRNVGGTPQLVLECGMDLWRRHADPAVNYARHAFDALRASALTAGWRPDAYGRWCCPRCTMNPHYATPQPLAHSHPAVRQAKYAGKDAAGNLIFDYAPLPDEFTLAVKAELAVLERTAGGANHGRHHRAGTP